MWIRQTPFISCKGMFLWPQTVCFESSSWTPNVHAIVKNSHYTSSNFVHVFRDLTEYEKQIHALLVESYAKMSFSNNNLLKVQLNTIVWDMAKKDINCVFYLVMDCRHILNRREKRAPPPNHYLTQYMVLLVLEFVKLIEVQTTPSLSYGILSTSVTAILSYYLLSFQQPY